MKKLLLILFLIAITSGFSFGEGSPEENNFFREKKYSITWGGHSTALIEINGKRILTDPLLTDNVAGIFSRKESCKLNLEDIPKIDIILLSHSHFDHLCLNSLEILEKKYPGAKLVFPEGVEDFIPDLNFDLYRIGTNNNFSNTVIGGKIVLDGIEIISVFAKHSGGRYGVDSYIWNDKGHTGFIIKYNEVSVYYSGDTGYDSVAFKRIGGKFKIDAALIQTGPCFDCDMPGTDEHASSVEALNIFLDLNAKYMMPVHYGSLEYDTEADYPVWVLKEIISKKLKTLITAGNKDGNSDLLIGERVLIPEEGEMVVLSY